MPITKWHFGKLIILWAWGGLFAGLALTVFLTGDVVATPIRHLAAFLAALLFLIVLSVITWKWLSGREGEK